ARQARIWKKKSTPGDSARTCITASMLFDCGCRVCANVGKTYRGCRVFPGTVPGEIQQGLRTPEQGNVAILAETGLAWEYSRAFQWHGSSCPDRGGSQDHSGTFGQAAQSGTGELPWCRNSSPQADRQGS